MCEVCAAIRVIEGGVVGFETIWKGHGSLVMRCKGLGQGDAEMVPGFFQIKTLGENWPERWYFTRSLAATCAAAGMTLNPDWALVPQATMDFLACRKPGAKTVDALGVGSVFLDIFNTLLDIFNTLLEDHPKGCPRGLRHPNVKCPQRVIKAGQAVCTGAPAVDYIRNCGLDIMLQLPCPVLNKE
jgi:hypothetical protein